MAAVALFLQQQYGYAFNVEAQMQIVVIANFVLRLVTKKELKA